MGEQSCLLPILQYCAHSLTPHRPIHPRCTWAVCGVWETLVRGTLQVGAGQVAQVFEAVINITIGITS